MRQSRGVSSYIEGMVKLKQGSGSIVVVATAWLLHANCLYLSRANAGERHHGRCLESDGRF